MVHEEEERHVRLHTPKVQKRTSCDTAGAGSASSVSIAATKPHGSGASMAAESS